MFSNCSRLSPQSGGPFERRLLRVEAGPENLLSPARNTVPACDDEQNSHGHVRQRVERADLTMRMICNWFTSRRMLWREVIEANTQMSVSVSLGMRRVQWSRPAVSRATARRPIVSSGFGRPDK